MTVSLPSLLNLRITGTSVAFLTGMMYCLLCHENSYSKFQKRVSQIMYNTDEMSEPFGNEEVIVARVVPPRPAPVECVHVTRENAPAFHRWVESHDGKCVLNNRSVEIGYDSYFGEGKERIVVHAAYGDYVTVNNYGHFDNIGNAAGYRAE